MREKGIEEKKKRGGEKIEIFLKRKKGTGGEWGERENSNEPTEKSGREPLDQESDK